MRFLLQCVAGFEPFVAELVAAEPFGAREIATPDAGLVAFSAKGMPPDLRRLPYANAVFLELDTLERSRDLDAALAAFERRPGWVQALKAATGPRERSVRLMPMDEGRPVAVDRRTLGRLAETISSATGLAWAPRGGDVELWAMRRRGGTVWLLKRLGRRGRTEKDLAQGELRPELAHLLVRLSEPRPGDVALDPFAGHGAIPAARAQLPYNMIFAFDTDPALVAALKARKKAGTLPERKKAPLIVRQADARDLSGLENGFVDAVVADPPWGLYDRSAGDLAGFYRQILDELVRVTKPGARLVLLLGRSEATEALRRHAQTRSLTEAAAYDILVSGKKATALKLLKTPGERE